MNPTPAYRIDARRPIEEVAADIQRAMASGATVEAIGLLDGDIVNVPLQSPPWERAQTIQLITTVLFPILTLVLVRR